jgi:hypothetical protein
VRECVIESVYLLLVKRLDDTGPGEISLLRRALDDVEGRVWSALSVGPEETREPIALSSESGALPLCFIQLSY